MTTSKQPARPVTRSGHVTAKSTASNGNGNGNRNENGTTNSRRSGSNSTGSNGDSRWWEGGNDAARMSERDRKRMAASAHAMGDHFHAMGDFLYRPDAKVDGANGVAKKAAPSKASKTTGRGR